jgi:hypothetical protein
MAHAPDPIDRFARFLAQSEYSLLTIKNYRSDLDAFAVWFQGANGEPMEPARITPTDLRQFKRPTPAPCGIADVPYANPARGTLAPRRCARRSDRPKLPRPNRLRCRRSEAISAAPPCQHIHETMRIEIKPHTAPERIVGARGTMAMAPSWEQRDDCPKPWSYECRMCKEGNTCSAWRFRMRSRGTCGERPLQ